MIIEKMADQLTVMEEAVRKGTKSAVMSRTGLTGGDGNRLYEYAKKETPLSIRQLYWWPLMHWQYQR